MRISDWSSDVCSSDLWFEQADGGTIFLDEIGELPLAMQTKLLRTLQEGTITRLGAKRELHIDVRLVAATNRALETEVAAGTFRPEASRVGKECVRQCRSMWSRYH